MTSILTALSLFAHMLVGCCWHHEHPCAQPPAEAAAGCAGHGGHSEDHGTPHGACSHEPGEEEHQGDGCDENRCVTVLRNSVRTPWTDAALLPAAVPEVAPQLDPASGPAVAFPIAQVLPPLPTHLVLQVLLL